jgi:quercetin 2,3-dioxygenase
MTARSVQKLHPAGRDDIGDLVTRRPLPSGELDQIDPFLFLNHHGPQIYPPGNRGLPFGPHPHRGFETVTFIIEGSLAHADSGGHESVIDDGGVQWMTAGSGIEHSEISPVEFLRDGGPLEILQLWINLPARLKMTEPRYVGLQKPEIPSIGERDGVRVSLIAGEMGGTKGAVESLTGHFLATVEVRSGATAVLPAPRGRSVFLYVVRGEVRAGTAIAPPFHLVEMTDDGDAVEIAAQADSLLIFGHAEPIGERVVAHGPFVMNSREEIMQAMRDYEAGLFSRRPLS